MAIDFEKILTSILGFILLYPFMSSFVQGRKNLKLLIIIGVILLGSFLRIYLAYYSLGNFDMESFEIVANLVLKGKNVYANTYRYNYSPIWFLALGFFKKLSNLTLMSFSFIIRYFLTIVDLASLYILYKITKLKKISFDKVAVYFFLNPISIILTGHHGQFENLTIFFILLGVWLYYKTHKVKPSWLFLTFAGIIKHLVFNQIIIFLTCSLKDKKRIILFFLTSVFLFLITFLPYWHEGKQGIINNVFFYRSTGRLGDYGVPNILERLKIPEFLIVWYKNLFYPIYFLFPLLLSSKKLIRNLLLGMLFFLIFAPGFALQYTVLPIALGSLRTGTGLIVYTLITSFYLMGHGAELDILRFKTFWHYEVWYAAIFWFFIEYHLDFYYKTKKKLHYE